LNPGEVVGVRAQTGGVRPSRAASRCLSSYLQAFNFCHYKYVDLSDVYWLLKLINYKRNNVMNSWCYRHLWGDSQNIAYQIGLPDLIGLYEKMVRILTTKWVCQIQLAFVGGGLECWQLNGFAEFKLVFIKGWVECWQQNRLPDFGWHPWEEVQIIDLKEMGWRWKC